MNLAQTKQKQKVFFKDITSLRIGGVASNFFVAQTIDDLRQVLLKINKNHDFYYFFGAGSNLLVADKEIKSPIVSLGKKFNYIKKISSRSIRVGAATRLSKVINYLIKENLCGLEGLTGIPASIGGLIAMNACAYACSISSFLDEVLIVTNQGDIRKMNKSDIRFSYRTASLKDYIILEATFSFKESSEIKNLVKKNIAKRLKDQDLLYPSAGCIFKNPGNKSAGALIQDSGFKGYTVGGAQVSMCHANFIINRNNASFKDVIQLIGLIKDKVYDKFGIILEEEIIRWE